ncbi:hypothetical protein K501DRAFT_332244, partial [Backusella circina FSU 941]
MNLTLVFIISLLVLAVIGDTSLDRSRIRNKIKRRTDYGESTMVDSLKMVPNGDGTGSYDRKESHYVVSHPESGYNPDMSTTTSVISGGGVKKGYSRHYQHISKETTNTDEALDEARKRYLGSIHPLQKEVSDRIDSLMNDTDDDSDEADQVFTSKFHPDKRTSSHVQHHQSKNQVHEHTDSALDHTGRYSKEEPFNSHQNKGHPVDRPATTNKTTTTVTTTTTTTTTTKGNPKKGNEKNGDKKKKKKKNRRKKQGNKNKTVTNNTDNSKHVNASKNINQIINIPSTESRKVAGGLITINKTTNNIYSNATIS